MMPAHFEELVLNRDFSESMPGAVLPCPAYRRYFINCDHTGGPEDLEAWLTRQAQHAA